MGKSYDDGNKLGKIKVNYNTLVSVDKYDYLFVRNATILFTILLLVFYVIPLGTGFFSDILGYIILLGPLWLMSTPLRFYRGIIRNYQDIVICVSYLIILTIILVVYLIAGWSNLILLGIKAVTGIIFVLATLFTKRRCINGLRERTRDEYGKYKDIKDAVLFRIDDDDYR